MTTKDKKGSFTGKVIIAQFTKEVTPFGTSGHINVGKQFIGDDANVTIHRKYLNCRRCHETFIKPENFSEDLRFCKRCLGAIEYVNLKKGELKCKVCDKKISPETYQKHWDVEICEDCWEKKLGKFNAKTRNKIEEEDNEL